MPISKYFHTISKAFKNAGYVTRLGFGIILKDPTILSYAIMATIFVAVTYALVSEVVLSMWRAHEPQLTKSILDSAQNQIPHELRDKLGIVTFYYFYTAIITGIFTCAAAAAVWAKLQGQPTTVFHGLVVIFKRFFRVAWFSILSILFIPIAIAAQWRKLFRHPIDVLGSSINMHIGGLAPAIVSSDDGVFKTIKTSTRTYGVAWHEALVIKAVTWLSLLILGTLSFLPKFIQHYHFAGDSARWVGWISSTVLVAVFFVLTKVISGVMMTTLYHQVKTNPERFK